LVSPALPMMAVLALLIIPGEVLDPNEVKLPSAAAGTLDLHVQHRWVMVCHVRRHRVEVKVCFAFLAFHDYPPSV
jgi:hypothetical protein